MFDKTPTRTSATEALYDKRAKSLVKQARDQLQIPLGEELGPREFAAWLSQKRRQLSRASWRQYRSAAIFMLEKIDSPEAFEAMDYLRDSDGAACAESSTKTSSTKLKRFPWKDFQKITDHLRGHPGKWHQPLLDWLVSSTLTGLRPQEWATSSVIEVDGEPALLVKNAKQTNGRAHGPTRTLMLGALAVEEIETISTHAARACQWFDADQFNDFYNGCALTLYNLTRKLWPRRERHITLYSCRHQFTANAKASGFSTLEIAAMMGHAVDTTATRHYGKKAAGHEMLRVRAIAADVDKVEGKFDQEKAKLRARARAKPDPTPKPKADVGSTVRWDGQVDHNLFKSSKK